MHFFSRKGFYALNVQCVVDHDNIILWASTYHKGESCDSSAFRETKLYKKLEEKANWLYERGYFILVGSVYAIEYFIMPAYALAKSKSNEDNFNFFPV